MDNYNLTYVTIDSLSEGVGSSQITPLLTRLAQSGLRINLISYEKFQPRNDLLEHYKSLGIDWNIQHFGSHGLIGAAQRLNGLRREISNTEIIHARSDIPAVSGVVSQEAPVLWDVRSLWADQKVLIQDNFTNSALYRSYRALETVAASKSLAMSTLTSAVVPILEQRQKKLPKIRTVVPTAVDLDRFKVFANFPKTIRVLFSGTYNEYYDLELSAMFLSELRRLVSLETHWARPLESNRSHLGVGEEKVIPVLQENMAQLIPRYSFGISVCKLNAGPSLSAAMPTKIGEFLACGRPIVVNKGLGDMDQFIKEFDAGVILDGGVENLGESAKSLVSLLSDSDTPNRCRALAEKHFNIDVGASRYLDVYRQIRSNGAKTGNQ